MEGLTEGELFLTKATNDKRELMQKRHHGYISNKIKEEIFLIKIHVLV